MLPFSDFLLTFIKKPKVLQDQLIVTLVISLFLLYCCLQVIVPLLRLLVKLHHQKIIHRDIKLENIFLNEHLEIKLGDFGLAIDISKELAFLLIGTDEFMGPEVRTWAGAGRQIHKLSTQYLVPYLWSGMK